MKRRLRWSTVDARDGEHAWRDRWVDVDETEPATAVAERLTGAPLLVVEASWIEFDGQESLI